jgi:signal transduction histidine kinase
MQDGGVARPSIRLGTAARVAFGLAAVGVGVGSLVLAQGPAKLTTYAGQSTVAAVLAPAAGFALVVAGLLVSLSRSSRLVGDVTALAGLTWFAPVWIGWHGGPPVARSLGMLAAGFTFPLILHAALGYPDGRIHTTTARILAGAAYAAAVLATVGLALFRDPFFDPKCWANCTDNVFLVRSLPSLARAIEVTERWFAVAAAAALVAVCAVRIARDSSPGRRTLVPVAMPAVLFAGAVAAHAIARQRMPKEDPSDPVFFSIFAIASGALILLAGGLSWGWLRLRLQRAAVARIVTRLGEAPPPGSLQAALARAVGDPALQIAYWLPGVRRFVDAVGQAVAEPVSAPGRATTALVRDGQRVAVMSHAAGVPEIEAQLGPAVLLALENERLQAEGLAQLQELRASRARIVETGDNERQRLERDLHDGAQQRLLAVSYEIRLARDSAEAQGDRATSLSLTTALEEVQAALDELRELAHGIYPAILAEAGLADALASVADTARIQVELGEVVQERLPSPVETAAYVVVVDALGDATTRGATAAAITAVRDNHHLVVTVQDDGSERTSAMVQLDDRVGALGGTLEVQATTLRAAIPCE